MRSRKPEISKQPLTIPDSIRQDGWWLVDRADAPTAKIIKFPLKPPKATLTSGEPSA